MHMHSYHKQNNIVGIGLLGFALGALAGVFLAPKSGKQNRENVANWMNNMSEELNRRVHNMRDLTMDKYNSLVDDIAYKYKKMQGIKRSEVDDFVSDLKMRWDRIKDEWNSGQVEY